MNHTTLEQELQQKWTGRKRQSELLSESFDRLKLWSKAARVDSCGTFLQFNQCPNGHYHKLAYANFCRERLCPMCNWRRSRKLAGQLLQIVHIASEREELRFVFLTLTIRNCKAVNLDETLDEFYLGFNQFMKYAPIAKPCRGWARTLEITYNPVSNTFHPHFHILLAMKPSYFKVGNYLTQRKITDLWQQAARLDYKPVVHVTAVKPREKDGTTEGAVKEVSKYAVKSSSYITKSAKRMDYLVDILGNALRGRRLIGFGGLFRDIRKEFKMQDVEADNADLVDGDSVTACQCPTCQAVLQTVNRYWRTGCYTDSLAGDE